MTMPAKYGLVTNKTNVIGIVQLRADGALSEGRCKNTFSGRDSARRLFSPGLGELSCPCQPTMTTPTSMISRVSSAGEYALAARSWILTQEAASVMTGISVTTYQKIENGHRMPRLENVVKLVDRLSIDSRALFLELGDFLPD